LIFLTRRQTKNPLIKKNGKFEEATWDEALIWLLQNLVKQKQNMAPEQLDFSLQQEFQTKITMQ
jgi:predicted molibdopterin-dependent oxidoreductase YjgC